MRRFSPQPGGRVLFSPSFPIVSPTPGECCSSEVWLTAARAACLLSSDQSVIRCFLSAGIASFLVSMENVVLQLSQLSSKQKASVILRNKGFVNALFIGRIEVCETICECDCFRGDGGAANIHPDEASSCKTLNPFYLHNAQSKKIFIC